MLPTSAFFKNIHCPYFNEGACVRPNCHFKHQKQIFSSVASYTSTYSKAENSYSSRHSTTPSNHAKDRYKPSAKAKKSAYRSAEIPRIHYEHDPFPTGPSTLVYKPTPISELNKIHAGPGSGNESNVSSTANAVISAQFKVLGQDASRSVPHETQAGHGDGLVDSQDSSKAEDELSMETDYTQPADSEDDLPVMTEAPSDSDEPAIEDSETIKPKRSLSKKEVEELADLFGEASDDEDRLIVEAGPSSSDEDVVEVPFVKKEDPFVDLTAETSSEDEQTDSTPVQQCKEENIKHNESKSSKHKSRHKSHKDKKCRRDKVRAEDASETVTPIIVSSADADDQCKELYEMFKRSEATNDQSSTDHAAIDALVPENEGSRKRKARDAAEALAKAPVKKKAAIPTPQELMHRRYEAMKRDKLAADKAAANGVHGSENTLKNSKQDYNSTPGVTSSRTYKGHDRKAHQPKSKKAKQSLERPRIAPSSNSKVAAGTRQLKLDMIIEECLKLYPDDSDAFRRAKAEEETAHSRARNRFIYTNLVANVIKKIRDETGSTHAGKARSMVSHEMVLAGKPSISYTVGLKRKSAISLTKEDMCGDLLFKKLRAYVLSDSQLVEQGYPRSHPRNPGHAVIQWTHYDKLPNNKGMVRTCRRCGKNFRLTNDGGYVTKEECVYHWGKSFQTRVHGTVDMHFSCCQGKPGAEGCTICNGHVHDSNKYEDLTGYMKTFAKNEKDYCGVYALDCEMVYTTKGLEIARVTVIDDKLSVMLDSLIKPEFEVIDYNTRFSGLTADNFKNVDTSLKDVQAILLNMFQENTVLIGHSLNSDLIALKLIHDNVVDTSLVWPHKHGLPYKRALKTLMLEILNKLIQESGSAGHDSSEDAAACMELMKWKVFQEYMKDKR